MKSVGLTHMQAGHGWLSNEDALCYTSTTYFFGSTGPMIIQSLRAAGKAHEALQHLNNGNESPGGWHISAMPGQDHNRAAKMGRREAWARFLAYDVSLSSSTAASTASGLSPSAACRMSTSSSRSPCQFLAICTRLNKAWATVPDLELQTSVYCL